MQIVMERCVCHLTLFEDE